MSVERPPQGVGQRFAAVEGLRAWLAWAVVCWHIVQVTGTNALYPALGSMAGIAHLAVELFIVLSGFVVTHRLVTRPEPYPRYLLRRAFRLFPLYLPLVLAGSVTLGLAAAALPGLAWANAPGFDYAQTLRATYASQQRDWGTHLLLHLLLLQGVVPDSVLPYSSATLLGPGWSLSLEWQFYLIAPLLVGGLRDRRWRPWVLGLLLAGGVIFQLGWMGEYRLISVFPAAAHLFLTGILSRLALARFAAGVRAPLLLALAGLALAVMAPSLAAIGLWIGFFGFMATDDRAPERGAAGVARRLWRAAFGARLPCWMGARAYSVYLAGLPILQGLLFLLGPRLGPSPGLAAIELAALAVPLTLIAAELLYRGIERPMIRLGGRLAAGGAGGDAHAAA